MWTTDIICVWIAEDCFHGAPVMDLFSWRIVRRLTGDRVEASLDFDALTIALGCRASIEVFAKYSDRGVGRGDRY